jgi:hypothetical protein
VVDRSGTPTDFLHIVAANPPYDVPKKFAHEGSSVLDASGMGAEPAVLLDGCAHVRIAGLRIENSAAGAAFEMRNTRDCVAEYIVVEKGTGVGVRATGRGNTMYECQVTGGAGGYEVAGSLTDLRWCASIANAVGFRTIGAVAGLYLLQNRHCGGTKVGFDLTSGGSDIVADGNWADGAAEWGFRVAAHRAMLVNNYADHAGNGIQFSNGTDARVFNNTVLSGARQGLVLGSGVQSALALNNILQSDEENMVVEAPGKGGRVWSDYNLYTRATLPFEFHGRCSGKALTGLREWQGATNYDGNSRLAPLIYDKRIDRSGRPRVRHCAVSTSSLTQSWELGAPGYNALPYTGAGTCILDLPQNWKPWGEPVRGVYVFDTTPVEDAFAARMPWFAARADYRRKDGRRALAELHRAYLPPDQIPGGSFCQDEHTARVFVRLPGDAADPNPIGQRVTLAPDKAIGCYVSRTAKGPAGKCRGKLVDEALAKSLTQEGATAVEVVPNVIHFVGGTPMMEKGCPILGIYQDADSMPRPAVGGNVGNFGCHPCPGRFDVGASECQYWVW